jgi:hypothetical protein
MAPIQLPESFLDAAALAASRTPGPFMIPWPMPGNLAGIVSFASYAEWQSFVAVLGLSSHVPQIVASKFMRAQKILLLSWIDSDLVKAAEIISLTALELALMDCYAPQARQAYGKANLAHLLRYMPEHDDLTDDKVGMNRRCGAGTVVGLLTGDRSPSLADIRNDGAHGYPFDGFPYSGLIELVRDLIEYAYRNFKQPS